MGDLPTDLDVLLHVQAINARSLGARVESAEYIRATERVAQLGLIKLGPAYAGGRMTPGGRNNWWLTQAGRKHLQNNPEST